MVSTSEPSDHHWIDELEVIDPLAHVTAVQMHCNLPTDPHQQGPRRRNGPGRKRNPETDLLHSFCRNGKYPFKKENLRTKVIRAHKKCLREMMNLMHCENPRPKKSRRVLTFFHEVNSPERYEKWLAMLQLCRNNPAHFAKICQTINGPLNDKSTQSKASDKFLCYNNAYCVDYFKTTLTRESFLAFLELVFEDRSEEELCTVFGGRCCPSGKHSATCSINWCKLKMFMFEDAMAAAEGSS